MTTDEFVKWAILAALGGLVVLLKWTADRLHKRVDELEKNKVSGSSFDDLKDEFREHRRETTQSLKSIDKNILAIVSKLNRG